MSEIEELQRMQREASKRRAERHEEQLAAKEATARQTEGEQAAGENSGAGAPPNESDSAEVGLPSAVLSDKLGSLLEELEETAREHPALALLAAFSLGVIAGQLFSRKK